MLSPPKKNVEPSSANDATKPQKMQQGSATGNPRNKVALAPGHSLMDWIRLGNSGKDLTGVGGRLLDVSPEMLARHNQRDDAWLAIRGNVYNVTHYMNFHPGGIEELERGIGTDATKLFSKVHSWVNYDSILKKCLVGRFQPRGGDSSSPKESSLSDKGLSMFLVPKEEKDKYRSTLKVPAESPVQRKLRWDWYEQDERGSLVLYCQSQEAIVKVALGKDNIDFQIEVHENGELCCLHFLLENAITWPVRILQIPNSSKVEIQLKKTVPGFWKKIGQLCSDTDAEYKLCTNKETHYSKMEVVDVIFVNYNTKILALSFLGHTVCSTPVGYHVRVRTILDGEDVVRCYTPISKSLVDPPSDYEQSLLFLMVKEYKEGSLSSWLAGRCKGATLDVSSPEGTFQTSLLANRKELYLFAAGTGFTPMVGVINWARKVIISKCTKITLMFFNRTEKDILWRDELDKLAEADKRFSVYHVLSEADETWSGLRGHIDGELLQSHLSSRSPHDDPKSFAFICGPTTFTQLTAGLLQVMGFSDKDYHCFLG